MKIIISDYQTKIKEFLFQVSLQKKLLWCQKKNEECMKNEKTVTFAFGRLFKKF